MVSPVAPKVPAPPRAFQGDAPAWADFDKPVSASADCFVPAPAPSPPPWKPVQPPVIASPFLPARPAGSVLGPREFPMPPMADAPGDDEGWRKWGLAGVAAAGVVGVAVVIGAVLGGVDSTLPPVVAPPSSTVGKPVSTVDEDLLRALDRTQDLRDASGSPLDALGAMHRLSQGQPVRVGIPRLATHPHGRLADPTGALTEDQAREQHARKLEPMVVQVSSFQDLGKLNAAERLTEVDTSSCLSVREREMLDLVRPFEGGVAGVRVERLPLAMQGVEYRVGPEHPSPCLLKPDYRRHYHASDRLTAQEACGRLLDGESVAVRSPRGMIHLVRNPEEMAALARMLPTAPPAPASH